MFNYFTSNDVDGPTYPTKKYFRWTMIQRMYREELLKIKTYYRGREYNYPNNNPIIRLIKTLSKPHDTPVMDYMNYLDVNAQYAVRQFGMITNGNRGKVLNNVLYQSGSSEAFLCTDNRVSPEQLSTDWLDYSPIRVIKSDQTDIHYPVLFRYDKTAPGLTVFEIDVRGLMLQYYYWTKSRAAAGLDTSANIFLPLVTIPNISDSLIDMAIWCRFKALATGLPVDYSKTKHPLHVIDYRTGIDKVLQDIIKDNLDTSIYVTQLLKTIPGLIGNDMYDTLQINKGYYTRQSRWVLWAARLRDITDIYKMIGVRGHRINKELFLQLPYEIKLLERRDTSFSEVVDPDTYVNVLMDIEYLKENVGRR